MEKAMAGPAVGVLLNKLYDLIEREAKLLDGVSKHVKLLQEQLEWMSLSLEEADNICSEDKEINLWVRHVRDATFQAEDIIEEYDLSDKKNRLKRTVAFHRIGKEIKKINSRLDNIKKSKSNLSLENVQARGEASTSAVRTERRSPRVEEADIVGIEDEAKKISKMLIGGGARTSVVSIVGMGGLGKTTLAKKVFNDKHIRSCHFQCYAWIYVSQEFIVRDLLYDLIKCVKTLSTDDSDKLKKMNEEELRGELFNCLKGKCYLIVIDDIWNKEAWDGIKASFPAENIGSRIMLTTRKRDVAQYADSSSNPHEMRHLTDDECLELLCKKAFPRVVNHDYFKDLGKEGEKIAKEIAKRCFGLPLAAVVLGGLLSTKDRSIHEWNKVLKAIDWHLKEGEHTVVPILALSYKDLPYYLKMCFLYFAAFPEDSSISVTKLFRMWIAEGFVQGRGDETPEEVAEDYLRDLIDRSLIQVAESHFTGRVNNCSIHDLLRDVAIEKAKEAMFLHVYGVKVGSASPATARRVAITHHDKNIGMSHLTKHHRSLLCSTQLERKFEEKIWKSLSGIFKFLRVMNLVDVHTSNLPDGIGNLNLLRYLSITFKKEMNELPSALYKLYNMQTLVIQSPSLSNIIQIHDGICKMTQLRHLDINKGLFISPRARCLRLDELTNLQTLSFIEVGDWIKGDFGELTSLRSLGLHGCLKQYQTELSNFIGKQKNLESLSLSTTTSGLQIPTQITSSPLSELEKLHLTGALTMVPTFQQFAPNLTEVVLLDSYLQVDPMAILEELPKLQVLKLETNSCFRREMCCSANGFPALAVLKIKFLECLEDWTVAEGAIANLRLLEIYGCSKLKMIPEGLQHVTTLQELFLLKQPPQFLERVQKNGLDWFKIQHVRSIVIHD